MPISTLAEVSNAEAVFVLLAAGLLLLSIRLSCPTRRWTLFAGVALLVLGGAGLATLSLQVAGVLMLVCAATSLAMEALLFPGVGLHAAGAGISLLLAGLYLTGEQPSAHPVVVVPVAVAVAVVSFAVGNRSWRRVRDQPFDAAEGVIGRGTVVLAADGAGTYGVVRGQLWQLRAVSGQLRDGQHVRVTGAGEQWLVVEPVQGRLHSW